jgi:hypothetical protein
MCGAAWAMLVPTAAISETTRLQTVDLSDRNMSAEGGEARLYRVTDAIGRHCRIEAVHFGETGRATYVFDFASKLNAAERREYRYDAPIHVNPNARQSLTESITLASPEGRKQLETDFEEYRSFFDPLQLSKCGGR